MQENLQAREHRPNSAKLSLTTQMIGHRLRSEHCAVLTEPLPERWMGMMNSIHDLPEHSDVRQNYPAGLPPQPVGARISQMLRTTLGACQRHG